MTITYANSYRNTYFDMVFYLEWETYAGPISFEVQRNDIWTDSIQSFEMPFKLNSTALGTRTGQLIPMQLSGL